MIALATGIAPANGAGAAPRVTLAFPLRCDIGRTCWIQKYPDLAAGPERRDYRCGTLTTDAHDGVDFRLASFAQMRRGVAVLAAASGKVLRIRDGEPDAAAGSALAGSGRDAGNGVVIDHGDGWETQYSHLASGSVQVRPGDRVAAGAPIGSVGLSGNTEYPHLHFAVRHRGTTIDPFTGSAVPGTCGARPTSPPLWVAVPPYRTDQLVRVAFTNSPQNRATLQRGDPVSPGPRDAMLIMVEIIGIEAGAVIGLNLQGPDGGTIVSKSITIDHRNLTWVGYAGVRAPLTGWKSGRYVGAVTLIQAGRPVQRKMAYHDL